MRPVLTATGAAKLFSDGMRNLIRIGPEKRIIKGRPFQVGLIVRLNPYADRLEPSNDKPMENHNSAVTYRSDIIQS